MTEENFLFPKNLNDLSQSYEEIHDRDYLVLEHIHKGKEIVKQRDLAKVIDASLGMTNGILKRLAQKGLLLIKKINNRNISYALTPEGVRELSRRSMVFFKRTIKNVVLYRQAMQDVFNEFVQLMETEDSSIALEFFLIGKSDLDFIVEDVCHHLGISLKYEPKLFLEHGIDFQNRALLEKFILSQKQNNRAIILSEQVLLGEMIQNELAFVTFGQTKVLFLAHLVSVAG